MRKINYGRHSDVEKWSERQMQIHIFADIIRQVYDMVTHRPRGLFE